MGGTGSQVLGKQSHVPFGLHLQLSLQGTSVKSPGLQSLPGVGLQSCVSHAQKPFSSQTHWLHAICVTSPVLHSCVDGGHATSVQANLPSMQSHWLQPSRK